MRRVARSRVSRIEAELSSDTHSGAGWVIALGALQIAAGAVGVAFALFATIAAVLTLGIVLLVAGASQLAAAVWARDRGGFFLYLLVAVAYAIAGMLSIQHPLATAEGLTLMFAAAMMVGGVYRTIIALAEQFPGWGWVMTNGLITVVLGVAIWQQWPWSGLWVIGTCVGIDLILNGITWVALASGVRRTAAPPPRRV